MRGLVFSPAKEEPELSVNGKRMRVEHSHIGRPGGCFTTEEIEPGASVESEQGRIEDDSRANGVEGWVLRHGFGYAYKPVKGATG
ncbi:unnamed protein product [Arabis nemorensis]|uniref:Uncharacterized protein n=1 Tax=Arabis nemorensis TaxID=586526 RepID=A0A565BUK3_9BRAS|nr:unnamed protein product [Arabis nemorensis]